MKAPTESPISANQMQCAQAFGVYTEDAEPLPSLIARIESAAGERALLERVRWFVLSVLRHLRHADWDVPEASELALGQQYGLASQCLASAGFAKSFTTVTKADTCKYTLVEFRRTKDVARRILSTNTAAYRQAAALLYGGQFVHRDADESQVAASSRTVGTGSVATPNKEQVPPSAPEVVAATADVRRARRRGYDDESRQGFDVRLVRESTQSAAPKAGMSPQEYAELEQALARKDAGSDSAGSLDFSDRQGRISWTLGVVAGLVLFALWWLVAS